MTEEEKIAEAIFHLTKAAEILAVVTKQFGDSIAKLTISTVLLRETIVMIKDVNL